VRHFTIELDELNKRLLDMGELAASAARVAVRTLIERNRTLAESVIGAEPKINRMEMEIDGMATRLLALYQPVARDLRFLTTALKISTNLERVGDLAMHISQRAVSLINDTALEPTADIPKIAAIVESMLLNSVDAFAKGDADLAHSVLITDEEVDRLRDAIQVKLMNVMQRDPALSGPAIDLLFIARNLERIGDHATNIAEDVIFLVKGIDVRHHAQDGKNL
jgi:phosphate transport system protein